MNRDEANELLELAAQIRAASWERRLTPEELRFREEASRKDIPRRMCPCGKRGYSTIHGAAWTAARMILDPAIDTDRAERINMYRCPEGRPYFHVGCAPRSYFQPGVSPRIEAPEASAAEVEVVSRQAMPDGSEVVTVLVTIGQQRIQGLIKAIPSKDRPGRFWWGLPHHWADEVLIRTGPTVLVKVREVIDGRRWE